MLTIADRDKFVNTGPFWERHPDVWPGVVRFEVTDQKGNIVESWERNNEGVMIETTRRDKYREELREAQEQLKKLEDNANE